MIYQFQALLATRIWLNFADDMIDFKRCFRPQSGLILISRIYQIGATGSSNQGN